ncbi:hypothetical protein [Nocardioides sp.]|uniref:hypothetical protein n=1 Tax=Nocardioides sp. TaxID=35761 RepID=UPI002B266C40|nr:hypothetical protein [Nocardioides sp.]
MTRNEIPQTPQIAESAALDTRHAQRSTLKAKHAKSLTSLLGTRSDLRGVHALADHLDDAIRWTA